MLGVVCGEVVGVFAALDLDGVVGGEAGELSFEGVGVRVGGDGGWILGGAATDGAPEGQLRAVGVGHGVDAAEDVVALGVLGFILDPGFHVFGDAIHGD